MRTDHTALEILLDALVTYMGRKPQKEGIYVYLN